MSFGERLKIMRDKKGWTQEDLAKHLNVSRDAIAGYEARGKIPRAEKLVSLARLLNTSTDYLFGLTDDPAPPKPPATSGDIVTCNTKEEELNIKGKDDQNEDVGIQVERLAAHLEGEYGEHDPEMAKFLHGVITEVLHDYKEFKRRQAEKRTDADE